MRVNPTLIWQSPVDIPGDKTDSALMEVPVAACVYVFFRRHGNNEQVSYVGKAKNLRSWIRGQLNNHGLMTAFTKAKSGKRQLVWAELKPRPGQRAAHALAVAERFMIKHLVEAGQPIRNVRGTKVKVQRLTNERGRSTPEFVPREVTMTT